jgi:hypothetical protein
MRIQVDLPATILAPTMARRLVERFIQACPSPITAYDRAFAIWLTSELVSMAVEYSSAPSTELGLSLSCDEESYMASLAGKDGVSLLARELADDTLRSRTADMIIEIADRWGSRADQDSDHVWIQLDLDLGDGTYHQTL